MLNLPQLLKAVKDLIETADKHRVGSMIAILGGIVVVVGLWVMRH